MLHHHIHYFGKNTLLIQTYYKVPIKLHVNHIEHIVSQHSYSTGSYLNLSTSTEKKHSSDAIMVAMPKTINYSLLNSFLLYTASPHVSLLILCWMVPSVTTASSESSSCFRVSFTVSLRNAYLGTFLLRLYVSKTQTAIFNTYTSICR